LGNLKVQAMKQLQLEAMSVDELWELHEQVSQVLSLRIIAEKQQLEQRLEQLNQAHQFGVSPEERPRRKDAAKGRRFYPKVYPKYQNPQEPSETWSGRGKQPRWLVKALQTGKKIDDFRIESEPTPAHQLSRVEG
jgi:DNA-binding protein H-NS